MKRYNFASFKIQLGITASLLVATTPSSSVTAQSLFTEDESSLKIVLTDEMVDAAVEYFHLLLNHPGSKSLSHALAKFYHPQLAACIAPFKCDICQRTKIGKRGYGHLLSWKQCDVGLIGPWYVSTSGRSAKSYEFYALTAINRATGYPDRIIIKRKTSENVARKFNEV